MRKKSTTKAKATKAAKKKTTRKTKTEFERMLEELTPEEISFLAWQKSYENRLKGKRLD